MAENNQESRVSLDTLAHTQDDVSNGVDFLVSKLILLTFLASTM